MGTTQPQMVEATDRDRDYLLNEIAHPYSLLVCRDRNWRTQRRIGAQSFHRLPEYEYVALSSAHYAPVMTIDVDDEFDPQALASLGFEPNWVGVNRRSGHYQLIIYLTEPVFKDGSKRDYFNDLQRGLTSRLDGDQHFARNLARSPFFTVGDYQWSVVHHERFSLNTLHEAGFRAGMELAGRTAPGKRTVRFVASDEPELDDERRSVPSMTPRTAAHAAIAARLADVSVLTLAVPTYDADGLQRRTYLFNAGRLEAYRLRSQGYEIDESYMREFIGQVNQAIGAVDPRGPREQLLVDTTAKSITSWVNSNMTPGGCGSGNGTMRRYTLEQCARGGAEQGRLNVLNGHWARVSEEGRKKGAENSRLVRGMKAIVDAEQIRVLQDEGMSPSEIMAATGFSRSKVYQARKVLQEALAQ